MDGLSHLAHDLIEIGQAVIKQNNDLGTMASYSQRETSELAEACLIHAGKIPHKQPGGVDGVIDELADSIQSAFVLACETLEEDPLSIMGLLQEKLKHKNDVWLDIIREQDEEVDWDRLGAIANQFSVKLVLVEEQDAVWVGEGQNDLYNVSFYRDRTIFLGVYDLVGDKVIAFFQKLSAILLDTKRIPVTMQDVNEQAQRLMKQYNVSVKAEHCDKGFGTEFSGDVGAGKSVVMQHPKPDVKSQRVIVNKDVDEGQLLYSKDIDPIETRYPTTPLTSLEKFLADQKLRGDDELVFIRDRADATKGCYSISRITDNTIYHWNKDTDTFTGFGTPFYSLNDAINQAMSIDENFAELNFDTYDCGIQSPKEQHD